MKNLKGKVKTFVEENKTKIVVGGLVVGTVAYKVHISSIKREYFMKGVYAGFQSTITWFDENFDNIHLRELWNDWAIKNADKVVKY